MGSREKAAVLSLGGSIVAPDGPDAGFLAGFAELAGEFLAESGERRLVVVVGGGGPARAWQRAYRDACMGLGREPEDGEADWIGVMATRLNAQLVKAALGGLCVQDVVLDPTAAPDIAGRALVAAGWKPGFSSDYDAVLLALRYGARTVANLSNIERVFTADPRLDPAARPLDSISWEGFRAMVGDEWVPGKSAPFDPIASRAAHEAGMRVICADGRNLANLRKILAGREFAGTVIG